MSSNVDKRLDRLRKLREELCSKSPAWKDGFKVKDWVVSEIEEIKNLASNPDSSKEQILKKASMILDTLKPKGE